MKKFSTSGGASHMDNWLQSIREGKAVSANLDVEHGHVSAGLAHLANISYRVGKMMSPEEVKERMGGEAMIQETLADFDGNLKANGIDVASEMAVLGPWLTVNPETERFEGEFAEEANGLLDERYRKGHELPVI